MATRCAACGIGISAWNFRTLRCPECLTMPCDRCRKFTQLECPVCGSQKAPKMPGAAMVIIYGLPRPWRRSAVSRPKCKART